VSIALSAVVIIGSLTQTIIASLIQWFTTSALAASERVVLSA